MKDSKELFEKILDNNEEIVEVIKPNKFRTLVLKLIFSNLFLVIVAAVMAVIGVLNPDGIEGTDGEGNPSVLPAIVFYGIAAFLILIIVINVITSIVRYNKLCYCYTNKRIIFCSGFIGADFKTLEYKSVLGMQVRVDLLDKLVKPNTGSIIFSSNALEGFATAQAIRVGGKGAEEVGFAFLNVTDAYAVYKRIKEYIDAKKEAK